ncbi:MAG TPA: D-2-hydroxyacid dehydrogenase [Bacteroidia bacterium]|nr:D-2-hydroxyacid dehydrogenase [Bacteroidia bacterium]HNU34676.1 D-2-hydroxyacid dehydrogenase [Bacteroidia bacterium]
MIKILANDGIDAAGKKIFEAAGFNVSTDKVAQENLAEALKNFDAILVRSATTVRTDLIDACPNLKVIGRAGVGMDNIDVKYARDKGIAVINTPAASSQSVAELVFAHLFTGVRFLHDANRNMPASDNKETFDKLKKNYSAGIELRGKTLGIIGAGQIGKCVAAIAMGLGMNVMFHRLNNEDVVVDLEFHPALGQRKVTVNFKCVSFTKLITESDFITLHVPFPKGSSPVIGKKEFDLMKPGVGIVNTARGGVVSENDLIESLTSGKVGFAGIDVFEGEPLVKEALRKHPKVTLSPHIGGSTKEAQERIGIELAQKVVEHFSKK